MVDIHAPGFVLWLNFEETATPFCVCVQGMWWFDACNHPSACVHCSGRSVLGV